MKKKQQAIRQRMVLLFSMYRKGALSAVPQLSCSFLRRISSGSERRYMMLSSTIANFLRLHFIKTDVNLGV
jgi:hypothetical protein